MHSSGASLGEARACVWNWSRHRHSGAMPTGPREARPDDRLRIDNVTRYPTAWQDISDINVASVQVLFAYSKVVLERLKSRMSQISRVFPAIFSSSGKIDRN